LFLQADIRMIVLMLWAMPLVGREAVNNWLSASFDLTSYSNQEVMFRFRLGHKRRGWRRWLVHR
jgi:hypothetical protein